MKKPDMTAVKQFLLEKGEKIGAIACTAIMVLVVVWSLYSGFTSRGAPSGKSWDDALTDEAKKLEMRVTNAPRPAEDQVPKPRPLSETEWELVRSNFMFMRLFNLPDPGLTKKLNPITLSIYPPDETEKFFQFDLVRDVYQHYMIDPPQAQKVMKVVGGAGAAGGKGFMMPRNLQPPGGMAGGMPGGAAGSAGGLGAGELAHDVRPVRMLVVSAVFPMKQQVEEFRKALRFADTNQLLARRDLLPKPIGLEVVRCEVLPGGKVSPWKEIFTHDIKANKTKIASAKIREMMRHMVIDEETPQTLAAYTFPGLVTPLPLLGNGKYPKVELKGIESKDIVAQADGDVANPMNMKTPKGGSGSKKVGFGFKPKAMAGGEADEPAAAAGGGAQLRLEKEAWKSVAKDLQERFKENYFMFDPLGTPLPEEGKKGTVAAGTMPPGMAGGMMGMAGGMAGSMTERGMGGMGAAGFANPWDRMLGGAGLGGGGSGGMVPPGVVPPGVKRPPGEAEENMDPEQTTTVVNAADKITDALVRFFDPDVQPGKTYRYSIRVRLANPNLGKKDDVAFNALADLKQLDWPPSQPNTWPSSGWMITPEVTVPEDYFWYATDQQPELRIKGGADWSNTQPGMAPVQVHRWIERGLEADAVIGAWAIGERFWVRRGDAVGRNNVMVEVPKWFVNKQAFEIANLPQALRGKKVTSATTISSGLALNLATEPPALVVDFDGGVRLNVKVGKDYVANDSSAYDILVLTTDGRLVMRNSRVDSDPEHPAGHERQERYEAWRDRLRELREGARPAAGVPPGGAGGMPPMEN